MQIKFAKNKKKHLIQMRGNEIASNKQTIMTHIVGTLTDHALITCLPKTKMFPNAIFVLSTCCLINLPVF